MAYNKSTNGIPDPCRRYVIKDISPLDYFWGSHSEYEATYFGGFEVYEGEDSYKWEVLENAVIFKSLKSARKAFDEIIRRFIAMNDDIDIVEQAMELQKNLKILRIDMKFTVLD